VGARLTFPGAVRHFAHGLTPAPPIGVAELENTCILHSIIGGRNITAKAPAATKKSVAVRLETVALSAVGHEMTRVRLGSRPTVATLAAAVRSASADPFGSWRID